MASSAKQTNKPPARKTRARTEGARAKRREALLAAALREFNQQGYQHTTIRQITRTAGLSTGTFYLYFQSKVEVFNQLYNQAMEILRGEFEKIAKGSGPAWQKLLSLGAAYKDFYQKQRPFFRILAVLHINQEEFHDQSPEAMAEIDANGHRLLDIIAGIVAEGVESGEFRPVDPKLVTTMLWGMIDGLLLMEERNNFDFAGTRFEEVLAGGLALLGGSLVADSD